MISRYSRPKMIKIWSDKNKFQIWFKIEAHACDAQVKLGIIPKEAAEIIWKKGNFNIKRINEIECNVKHDVIAFLTNLTEYIGPNARFIHQGMTSSDVLDTCFNIQLVQATDTLMIGLNRLLDALKKISYYHKNSICIGRSHGIHAEPTTFGLKMAQAYAEFNRNKQRLIIARKEIATCAISGAVGTFANINPKIEKYVAKIMGLEPELISTQIIPRDHHAMYFSILGIIASSIERLSVEIRHLQRTEVLEVEEYFSKNQKGSSAMPHKRNPVLTENLTGQARLIRMAVIPAMENIVLWHERDISHSSVERIIGPDATTTLDFSLHRMAMVIENLLVYPKNMIKNMNKLNGLIYSQRILLKLTQLGISREKAYNLVQKIAMIVWDKQKNFLELLKKDKEICKIITNKEIEKLFDITYHTKYIDQIFYRVFNVK